MLYRIEVENFFSISDRQVIDLRVRKSVKDELGRLKPIYKESPERCPSVLALFGANGAGKSNLLKAISFIRWFIAFFYSFDEDSILPYDKFSNHEMQNKPTRFALYFTGPVDFNDLKNFNLQCPYKYELVIDSNTVVLEKLSYQPKKTGKQTTLFTRNPERTQFVKGFITKVQYQSFNAMLRPWLSGISTLGILNTKFEHQFAKYIIEYFRNIQMNTTFSNRFETKDSDAVGLYSSDSYVRNKIRPILKRIDLGITDIQDGPPNRPTSIQFRHKGLDQPIDYYMESHGTREFVKIFPLIQSPLDIGGIVIIDDIDSCIHPNLLLEVIRMFRNEKTNPNGAQLIMSTHAVSILTDLTKEEVLLCDKNSMGQTRYVRLADIKGVRRDENFFANYINGIYGSVPSIG